MIHYPDCAQCGKPLGIRRGDLHFQETCTSCQATGEIEYLSCDLGEDSVIETARDAFGDATEKVNIFAHKVGAFLRNPSGMERNSERSSNRVTTVIEAVVVIMMIAFISVLFVGIVYYATAIETDQDKEYRRMDRSFNIEASDY